MSEQTVPTGEIKVFLTLHDFAQYRPILQEALQAQDWNKWMAFVVERKIIVSWDCLDREGNPLNPTSIDDLQKLSMDDFNRVIGAIQASISGAAIKAKN